MRVFCQRKSHFFASFSSKLFLRLFFSLESFVVARIFRDLGFQQQNKYTLFRLSSLYMLSMPMPTDDALLFCV